MKYAAILLLVLLAGCAKQNHPLQADVVREISESNYCEVDADCTVLTGKCPFGCYVAVNASKAKAISSLLDSFESTCVYSCTPVQPVHCKNNTCLMDEYVPEATYDQDSWKDSIDDSCLSYFDGCNNCRRNENDEFAACTRKFCQEYKKPYCLDNEE